MPSAMPANAEPFLREFLYVDTDRVRSLLGQLYEGVPEQIKNTEARHRNWQLGLRGLAGAEGGPSSGEEETRALSDLHFSMLEEVAEATGFLRDISDHARDARQWKRGKLHKTLSGGDLVRVTAPTRILDPRYITATLESQDSAFGQSPDPTSVDFAQVKSLVHALYGPGVVVRSFPAGLDEPECNFVGTLLDDPRYIERERATLFARHGVEAQEWTIVGQVARLTTQEPAPRLALSGMNEMMSGDGHSLNRGKFEEFLAQVMQYIEKTGLSEGPQHPAIALTPLAVYRVLLKPDSQEDVS